MIGETAAVVVEKSKVGGIGQAGVEERLGRGIIRRGSDQEKFFGVWAATELGHESRQAPGAFGTAQCERRKSARRQGGRRPACFRVPDARRRSREACGTIEPCGDERGKLLEFEPDQVSLEIAEVIREAGPVTFGGVGGGDGEQLDDFRSAGWPPA